MSGSAVAAVAAVTLGPEGGRFILPGDWFSTVLWAVPFPLLISGMALLGRRLGSVRAVDTLDARVVALAVFLLVFALVIHPVAAGNRVTVAAAMVFTLGALFCLRRGGPPDLHGRDPHRLGRVAGPGRGGTRRGDPHRGAAVTACPRPAGQHPGGQPMGDPQHPAGCGRASPLAGCHPCPHPAGGDPFGSTHGPAGGPAGTDRPPGRGAGTAAQRTAPTSWPKRCRNRRPCSNSCATRRCTIR